jgi:hypothetical protein
MCVQRHWEIGWRLWHTGCGTRKGARQMTPAQGGYDPLMQRAGQLGNSIKRHSRNPVGERVCLPARIDDPQMFQ